MKKTIKRTLNLALCLLVCLLALTSCNIANGIPQFSDQIGGTSQGQKYEEACELIDEGKLEEAYAILKELNDYEPAKEKIKNFFYAPQQIVSDYYGTYTINYNDQGNTTQVYLVGDRTSALVNNYTYDEFGNRLSGSEPYPCDNGDIYYTYENKKLIKITKNSGNTEHNIIYKYNTNGELIQENNGNTTYNFSYTYYSNNNIKSKTVVDNNNSAFKIFYDENGNKTEIVGEGFKITYTYNEFGVSEIKYGFGNASNPDDMVLVYDFSYDSVGKLLSLEMSTYSEGFFDGNCSVITYSNHKLCYSENPYTHARMDKIMCRSLEALVLAMEILM